LAKQSWETRNSGAIPFSIQHVASPCFIKDFIEAKPVFYGEHIFREDIPGVSATMVTPRILSVPDLARTFAPGIWE
jgi:hypothetical protein